MFQANRSNLTVQFPNPLVGHPWVGVRYHDSGGRRKNVEPFCVSDSVTNVS